MAKRKDKSGVVINAKAISGLFDNISELIEQSRQRVAYHLNSEMVSVNWYIGSKNPWMPKYQIQKVKKLLQA